MAFYQINSENSTKKNLVALIDKWLVKCKGSKNVNVPRNIALDYANMYPLTKGLGRSTLGKPGEYHVLEDYEGQRFLAPEIPPTDKDQLVWSIPLQPVIIHKSGCASKLYPDGITSPLNFISFA